MEAVAFVLEQALEGREVPLADPAQSYVEKVVRPSLVHAAGHANDGVALALVGRPVEKVGNMNFPLSTLCGFAARARWQVSRRHPHRPPDLAGTCDAAARNSSTRTRAECASNGLAAMLVACTGAICQKSPKQSKLIPASKRRLPSVRRA